MFEEDEAVLFEERVVGMHRVGLRAAYHHLYKRLLRCTATQKWQRYDERVDTWLAVSFPVTIDHASLVLLLASPESYTPWNIRKRLLSAATAEGSAVSTAIATLRREFGLTAAVLGMKWKSTCAWQHR